jgi:shikimate kinase
VIQSRRRPSPASAAPSQVLRPKAYEPCLGRLLPGLRGGTRGTVVKVLLTGMSGTGKSTVIRELAARGYRAVDTDDGWSEPGPDGEWLWREERIQSLLSLAAGDVLFLSGCARNQVKFYPQFDHIVLLSAPAAVIMDRLATRTNNPYGKHPDELACVLVHLQTVEPLLRRSGGHEIDTSAPLDEVVATLLRLVQPHACR